MDHKTKLLLVIDASINLVLGILLLAYPAGIPQLLGLPVPTTYFYTSILGAVLFGIGLALLLERYSRNSYASGLGLAGAILINLCGGITLLSWLVLSKPALSQTGSLLLWLIAMLVIATGAVELIGIIRAGYSAPNLSRDQLKEQVIQRELEWTKAHRDLDLAVIQEILSEDFQSLQPEGSHRGKAELLKSYGSGNRSWEIAESTHHHVLITGELAVLVGRWRGKGVNTGEAFDYQARFFSIYRNEAGVWRMILEYSLPIPK